MSASINNNNDSYKTLNESSDNFDDSDYKPPIQYTHVSTKHYEFWFIILATIFTLFTSGIVFGWSALQSMLIKEGLYNELCDVEDEYPCNKQLNALNIIFIYGSTGVYISNSIFGAILDYYGARMNSIIASILLFIGTLLCIYDIWEIGFLLIGIAGPGIQISSFHLFEVYPKYTGTLMQISTSAFDAGSLLYALFLLLHNDYWTVKRLFILYLLIPIIILFITSIAWSNQARRTHSIIHGPFTSLSLKKQILSFPFLYLSFYAAIHSLRINYIIATIYDQFYILYQSDSLASLYSYQFSLILPFGFIIVPLTGYLLDKKGSQSVLSLSNWIGLIYAILTLFIDQIALFYIMTILVAISRQMVFGTSFSSLSRWYGNATFGRLAAVQKIIVSIICLLLYPIVDLSLDLNNFTISNWIMIVLMIPLFLYQKHHSFKDLF